MLADEVRALRPKLDAAVGMLTGLATVSLPGDRNCLDSVNITLGPGGSVISRLVVRGIEMVGDSIPVFELVAVQKRRMVNRFPVVRDPGVRPKARE